MSHDTFDHYFITGAGEMLREEVEAYKGDEFWVEYLTNDTFPSREAAKTAGSAQFVAATLAYSGLESILADKHSTAALKEALLARDVKMIKALERYMKKLTSRGKGGRPPKLRDGKPMGDLIVELTKAGVPVDQIARSAGTTPSSVRSQQAQARKKGKLLPLP